MTDNECEEPVETASFEEKDVNRQALSRLVVATATCRRGDFIPWSVIEAAVQARRDEALCRYTVKRWRTRLLQDRGIAMRPVHGEGYQLLTSVDQVERCAVDRRRRMSRQALRAIQEVRGAQENELTDHQLTVRAMQLEALRDERSKITKGIKSLIVVRRGLTDEE